MLRIGIDARFLTHPQCGGFKTYTRNLVTALAEIDFENQYILYLDRKPNEETLIPDCPNITTQVIPGLAPLVGMPWREQVGIARRATIDKLDLLHSPCLTAPLHLACRSVVTIHDMIWYSPAGLCQSKCYSRKRQLMEGYYRFVPKLAAKQAAAVITVSHAAKESIVQHLGITADKVFVTHEGASHLFRPIDDLDELAAVRQKYGLTSNFVLAIGSADPRKNVKALLQAYATLPLSLQERYHLAIVWTHPLLAEELAARVESLDLNHRVHFLQHVCDDDLVLLYNAASLFVFPSLYEGFGLPPLEAMACGTPVLAADNSSIPEIVGDAAVLTKAGDVRVMAELMTRVLDDKALQRVLVEKGLERASGFSWIQCAFETLNVYKYVSSYQGQAASMNYFRKRQPPVNRMGA